MLVQCKRNALSLNPPFPSRTRVKKMLFLNCYCFAYRERRKPSITLKYAQNPNLTNYVNIYVSWLN